MPHLHVDIDIWSILTMLKCLTRFNGISEQCLKFINALNQKTSILTDFLSGSKFVSYYDKNT